MLDALSDQDQAEMASLLVYEASLCGGCHLPLDLSLRGDVTWLVDDYLCTACMARDGVSRTWSKEGVPEQARDGRMYSVRAKEGCRGR